MQNLEKVYKHNLVAGQGGIVKSALNKHWVAQLLWTTTMQLQLQHYVITWTAVSQIWQQQGCCQFSNSHAIWCTLINGSHTESTRYHHQSIQEAQLYRRGTARCVLSLVILPTATQQCRNYLYDKF